MDKRESIWEDWKAGRVRMGSPVMGEMVVRTSEDDMIAVVLGLAVMMIFVMVVVIVSVMFVGSGNGLDINISGGDIGSGKRGSFLPFH